MEQEMEMVGGYAAPVDPMDLMEDTSCCQ